MARKAARADLVATDLGAMDSVHRGELAVGGWSPRRKILVSLLLALHLCAVFAAPCAVPPPSSYLAGWFGGRVVSERGFEPGIFAPYLQATYLQHGYRFFAPNPGPSHLIRYEIDLAEGGQVKGEFPNLEEYSPRLLYHRMFMIAETVFNIDEPLQGEVELEAMLPGERIEYQRQRECSRALLRSVSRHLLQEYQGHTVRLYLREHVIPLPQDVLNGVALNDPRFYRERPLGEFHEADL